MPKVDELYAFIAEEGPGQEGIMAAMIPGLGSTPLVCATKSLAEKFVPIADDISRVSGRPYKLIRFKLVGEVVFQRHDRN